MLGPITPMKQIFLFFNIFIISNSLIAQDLPKFIQNRLDFCDSNLKDEQVTELRKELNDLEDYFLMNGLLANDSESSYRAVYEQIVKQNDLIFEIDTTFSLLDNLKFQVYTSCFFKVLTPEQLSQLTQRHQKAVERISGDYEGNVTPGLVAQRILDNLTEDDFKLEFFKISALLSFYRTSSPTSSLNLGLPAFSQGGNTNIQTIQVILNENSQIVIDNNVFTAAGAELAIYEFLSVEPKMRGIEFMASRGASYETYLITTEIFNSVYSKLKSEKGDIPKNIIFREPK